MRTINPTNPNICTNLRPDAIAEIYGNTDNPNLYGTALFYNKPIGGIIVQVEVYNLPDNYSSNNSGFFGMHIHEFGNCTQPFDKTGNHFNPHGNSHPNHAGDMPPLLSDNGYAWIAFYDGRLTISDIINKSIIIHSMRDDFTSQPSGDSGIKIGCGIIEAV